MSCAGTYRWEAEPPPRQHDSQRQETDRRRPAPGGDRQGFRGGEVDAPRARSRNPVLAQGLSFFHRIEERGSGFRRMADQMLDHGLDRPLLVGDAGYF
ncbi:MAG: ATP-binding protein [Planctomycetota bacterium]